MPVLRLGTRGSPLALWQARFVAGLLETAHPGTDVEIRIIKTEGDQRTDVPLTVVGGKGVFVREIEEALLAREIDLAVHSLKDLPTEQPDGLAVTAVLARHDPRDALLSGEGWDLETLPRGASVATGSPRRRCQLMRRRADLEMTLVRGNIDTRIRKLREGQFAAMMLAMAGLERLGLREVPATPLPPEICLPAPGQGALAIESRSSDARVEDAVGVLDHAVTRAAVVAERSFLAGLGGGCLAPAAALAVVRDGVLRLEAMVGDPNGAREVRRTASGAPEAAEGIGRALAAEILGAGGDAILAEARAEGGG